MFLAALETETGVEAEKECRHGVRWDHHGRTGTFDLVICVSYVEAVRAISECTNRSCSNLTLQVEGMLHNVKPPCSIHIGLEMENVERTNQHRISSWAATAVAASSHLLVEHVS